MDAAAEQRMDIRRVAGGGVRPVVPRGQDVGGHALLQRSARLRYRRYMEAAPRQPLAGGAGLCARLAVRVRRRQRPTDPRQSLAADARGGGGEPFLLLHAL